MRRLIVNADDLGFTRDVNDGIVEAHRNGILTSATLMANSGAFHHGVICAKENPRLGVGVHLVLVGERSLSNLGRALPEKPAGLVAAVLGGGLDVARELDLQMRRVVGAGIDPTHLDTHKHTHLMPQVAEAVGKISEKYGVRWVRRPLAKPVFGAWSTRILLRHGCRMADRFAGYELTGKLGEAELVRVIETLLEGTTEFMCHPGYCREELREARTRLKESREVELRALTSLAVREAVVRRGVELIGYRGLDVNSGGGSSQQLRGSEGINDANSSL
jgi:predicted glycoside hydrolase/deacetylase ChbG (UPF0249 family)